MLILNALLDISPFKGSDPKSAPTLIGEVKQTTRAKRIFSELMKLKSDIDTKRSIFKTSNKEVTAPNYKGENRYLGIKGLLNSMAQKFERLNEHLTSDTADDSNELKKKLVQFDFGDNDDILDNLRLNDVKEFQKLFYNINSPIFNLRKLFRDYEDYQSDANVQPKTHPFAVFITESADGEELKPLDKANGNITFLSHPGDSQSISIVYNDNGNTSERQSSASTIDSHDAAGKDKVIENSNDGRDSPTEMGVGGSSEKVITEPSESASREDESLDNVRETKEQQISTGEVSGEDNRVSVVQAHGGGDAIRSPDLPVADPTLARPSSASEALAPSSRVQPSNSQEMPPTPSGSLRTGSAEKSLQKASSAFDSFVTMLLVVSAAFAL
ncbi:hypothetical protein BBBOND_0205960 [Babesia bigemina]|uniref:Uncharacterized protein n=1 Tax=Babesia bigemina TaxID=5866 RepID=A0A061D4D1_BABBI|nr:hypothetical protein BBBOND_0205960 [Babesia bigemina]CDR95438.1 hypothetical protein BBBOND_0205960 [Babesia bigemina]|eukprot:XP_012767624.1 hypothetical protein BBBOND_0205960 [Babesia bigemina]